jgi:glycerol-3-phosphate dehydrogenase
VCRRLRRSEHLLHARHIYPACAEPADTRDPGPDLDAEVLAHIEESYGPSRDSLRALVRDDAALATRIVPDLPVILGQVVQAARTEMAVHLTDVVRRRTPLYLSDALDRSALTACASVLARELRWSRKELVTQIDEVETELAAFRGPLRADSRPVAA